MNEIVICEPVRSPVGRYGGFFRDVTAVDLATQVVNGLLRRTELDPSVVSDVILGQCYPNGEAPAIGRVVALESGMPIETTGVQIDRRCGSGLQAVIYAAMQVSAGFSDLVIAGGVESMSQSEFYTTSMRWGARAENQVMYDRIARGRVTSGGSRFPVPGGMLETAENLRERYGISREAQDRLALESHRRAVSAQERDVFVEEIIPITLQNRRGEGTVVSADEHPRPGLTLDDLAAIKPVLEQLDADATVTAGNASGQNDGAAVCIVTTRERAAELGLTPFVRIISAAIAGVHPATMGIGPVPATELALKRAQLDFDDMDLVELNEAFAAQVLACTAEWSLDDDGMERLNVNGSGISLGHAVGGTGARILATLAREMRRREVRFGLETLCIGGGQGIAAVFERV